jgi:hypothetical protein
LSSSSDNETISLAPLAERVRDTSAKAARFYRDFLINNSVILFSFVRYATVISRAQGCARERS